MLTYTDIANLMNNNQGVLASFLFLATLFFGWLSGIFSALRRKPKFKIGTIDGPTFACTFPIGKSKGDYKIHRTCLAIYLRVSNIGSSPSSLENISVGYHWNLRPFSRLWLKNSVGWFWLNQQAVALEDFQTKIGGTIKIYPFLFQTTSMGVNPTETYLNVGQSTNGVIYFEQPDSWGGCFPRSSNDQISIKTKVLDTFGKTHSKRFNIPYVSLEHARSYNPAFGKTISQLNEEELPFDSA